jgi:adhesin transport system outer membrane protein
MKRIAIRAWSLAVVILPMGCLAQSLQEAVQIALKQYPALGQAKAKTEAAQAEIIRAKAPHRPQFSWSGTYNDYRSTNLSNRWVQSPSLSLNLWSGKRIQSDVERAEALASASHFQEKITRDDVALLISEGYLQWAHFKNMVNLGKENLAQHKKILNDFQKIAAVDTGRRIDLHQAQVRFDNANLSLMKSEAEMTSAMQRVSRMLNKSLPVEPTGIDFSPPIPFSRLEQAIESLNSQHPVIANLKAQSNAAQASVQYAKAQNSPTVNLTHTKNTTPGFADGKFVTQLQLNIPLYDGGSSDGAVGIAQANLKALEYALEETHLILSEELKTNWTQWLSSKQRVELGQQQTQMAKDLVYGYTQQFQVGRRSLLDLLNIQSDFYTYQSNAATAHLEARIAQERILANLGQLANLYTPTPIKMLSDLEQTNSVQSVNTTLNTADRNE